MAVHLLSLPGSTLVPTSDDQPHRIHLCYRAPSYPANQRVWLTDRDFNHGFQTRYRSQETLAPTQRIRFAPKSGHRRPFYRWRGTARTSCLTVINRGCAFFPYTTFDNISRQGKGDIGWRLAMVLFDACIVDCCALLEDKDRTNPSQRALVYPLLKGNR